MPRRKSRLYEREGRGWYADFRDYRDVGGKREAMIPEGERTATHDRDEAIAIVTARLKELKQLRKNGEAALGTDAEPTLGAYARRFLKAKARNRRNRTVERYEGALRKFTAEWGEGIRLSAITPEMCEDYMDRRLAEAATQTVLHEMHALGGVFGMAVKRRKLTYNPVAVLELPEIQRRESEYLEIGEAARLIKAALRLDGEAHSRACPYFGPILATGLLSGGRLGAVLSLEVRDVDFDAGLIRYRPNGWYRLKGKPRHAERTVPLWPQLREILTTYVETFGRVDAPSSYTGRNTRYEGTREPRRTLLFPAEDGGMLRDLRVSLANAIEAAEVGKRVTFHTLRHTYGATRMQTLDGGAPVSPYTVMRELGHSSLSMIEKVYGHLQDVRHRAEVVEYREAKVVSIERTERAG